MSSKAFVLAFALSLSMIGCHSNDSGTAPNESVANNGVGSPVPSASVTNLNSPSPTPAVKAKMDVCGLIKDWDIKSVQGEQPTETQRSDREDAGFIVTQCYYSLPTTSNSVVLNVTTASEGRGARDPRAYFNETFASKAEKFEPERKREGKAKENEAENESEEGPRPQKIAGLGEDAYWIASRVGGALYVLKKSVFFRISVGGAGDVKEKLKKSKTLAQKVLARL